MSDAVTMDNAIRMDNELSALIRVWVDEGIPPSQIAIGMTQMGFAAGFMAGLRPVDMSAAVPEMLSNARNMVDQARAYNDRLAGKP